MSIDFPLPIVWRSPVNLDFTPRHACHVEEKRLTARCGDWIIQLAAENGAERWRTEVQPLSGGGTFFLAGEGLFVTDFSRQPERLAGLQAVGTSGKQLWRQDLQAVVIERGASLAGRGLFLAVAELAQGGALYRIDALRGDQLGVYRPAWGIEGLVSLGGRLLVRTRFVEAGNPGLYTLEVDGTDPRPVMHESTWDLIHQENWILAVSRSSADAPRRIHVIEAATLAVLWTAEVINEAVALDDSELFTTELAQGQPYLTARQAPDGAILWRSGPLTTVPLQIHAAGPLLFCRSLGSNLLYRRAEGTLLGEIDSSYVLPTVDGERLYLFDEQALLCVSLCDLLLETERHS